MSTETTEVSPGFFPQIPATKLPESQRMPTLPRFFPRCYIRVENEIFDWMNRLAPDEYDGGVWSFYQLGNGGFFMAPDQVEGFTIHSPNGSETKMSAQAAGITACLFTYSHLSFKFDQLAERFHQLREFALGHPEAEAILAAID